MVMVVRRIVASVLAWVVGAIAAVGVGILALSLLSDGLTGRAVQPIGANPAAQDSGAAAVQPSDQPSSPDPASSPAPMRSGLAAAGPDRTLTSPGGLAVARCVDGQAFLVSWSPAQGYRVEEVARGPDSEAKVVFRAGTDEVHLSVRCVGGVPQPHVERDHDG